MNDNRTTFCAGEAKKSKGVVKRFIKRILPNSKLYSEIHDEYIKMTERGASQYEIDSYIIGRTHSLHPVSRLYNEMKFNINTALTRLLGL